jgi:C4-dicarboxylate-specific signal transduction histidine kinase
MIEWARNRLAVRQAVYAVTAIVAVASLVSLIAIVQFYLGERDRIASSLSQQIETVSSAAARAAFHVDDIQANAIIEGLFHLQNLEWARVSTDLGEVLAEDHRVIPSSFVDPLARLLFSDVSSHRRDLKVSDFDHSYPEGTTRSDSSTIVGVIEANTSPELLGREFLDGIASFVAGLLLQFVLLGVTMVVILHRTLTLPLVRYADAVSRLGAPGTERSHLEVPKGHEQDEFGMVVARTNQLLERLKTQHEELLHREKISALGTLLTGVSHELNNPLAILVAHSELLVETSRDPEAKKRGEKILAMANRCTAIVDRFLTLARRRKIEKEPLDIEQTIADVLEILGHQLQLANVETTVTVAAHLPRVLADPIQLTQVLLNIVVNARQALESKPGQRKIVVEANSENGDGAICVTVSDNGPGIAPEKRKCIFEPFYTTKSEGKGTGLGLSYAFDVVRDHGGNLTVGDSRLGGAAFKLVLPTAPNQESRPSA